MVRFDRSAAAHLFRRAGFGADSERLDRAVSAGLAATVEELWTEQDDDPLLAQGLEAVVASESIDALAAWWLACILRGRTPLVDRVALLWHNHFATSWHKVEDARLMHGQLQLFRRAGLGSFRELLHSVAIDPAMLIWLDGCENRRGHANENFARELLELFALGIGNYDERDIQEAARAFSGWGIEGRRAVFRPAHHDAGEKLVLGVRGALDERGATEAVLAHPACSRHIARRLLCEFVTPDPGPDSVERWARTLVDENWRIGATLRRLFVSEEFFAPAARRSRIAGPVEWIALAVRSFELEVAPSAAARAAAEMGQALFRPPSVKGWDGGRAWIHAGSWLARCNHVSRWVTASFGARRAPDALRGLTPPALAAAVAERCFPEGFDETLRSALERGAKDASDEKDALRRVMILALTSPEFHLV